MIGSNTFGCVNDSKVFYEEIKLAFLSSKRKPQYLKIFTKKVLILIQVITKAINRAGYRENYDYKKTKILSNSFQIKTVTTQKITKLTVLYENYFR